jgi:hypothetical protein
MIRIIFLLILFFPTFAYNQIKIDKAGDEWNVKIDSALNIIKTYDSSKYFLLLDVCTNIEFWNGDYSTNDGKKSIVVSIKDVKLNSINNLAAILVHESLHLHYSKINKILDNKLEENICYKYEFSFLEKLPNVETWLWRHTLGQIIKNE